MTFPINFRAFPIIAITVIASVFCVYAYMFNKALGITLGIILICLVAVSVCLVIFKYRCGGIKLRAVFTFIIALLFCTSAFTVGVVSFDKRNENYFDGYCTVFGRVAAVDIRSGMYRFNLDELMIDGKDVDGIMRISFTASDTNIAEVVDCGDMLTFGAKVSTTKLYDNGHVNGTSYRNDIRYTAAVVGDGFSILHGKPTYLESFLSALKSLYVQNMGERYGNIAFSMLIGDKYGLDSDISDYYTASGLGHIMAVSGLHIGFFVLLLNLILSKINKKIRMPIIGAVLIAYTVIADFSPSVVRAVIMAFIAGLSFIVGGRRDILSSLFCAFSCILTVKPFYLFDASFLLSFGAIFGIALFANSFKLFMISHGIHHKVGNVIGASASVSVGILPAQVYFFGKLQTFALIINTIALPYISVIFVTLVCITPIAAIPSCGVLLKLSEYLMMPLDYIAYGIASVPFAQISLRSSAAVFACYPIMFCASGYFMAERAKTAIVLYSVVICAAISCVCLI